MGRFLCTFSLSLLGILGAAIVAPARQDQLSLMDGVALAVSVWGMPVTFVAGVTHWMRHRRLRRVFGSLRARSWRPVALALMASALSIAAASVVFVPLGWGWSSRRHFSGGIWMTSSGIPLRVAIVLESLIFAVACGCCTWLVLQVFGGRHKAGLCSACEYDISASLEQGRCPECGAPLRGWSRHARTSGRFGPFRRAAVERAEP